MHEFNRADLDAGLGLIYRLNDLWRLVDIFARRGDYNAWEITLDRIFANLDYRDESGSSVKDESGNVIDVILEGEHVTKWKILKKKIAIVRKEMFAAYMKQNKKVFSSAKIKYYNELIKYDIWLRRFMMERKLYLKETETNPSRAMFGGAFTPKYNKR